MRDFSADHRWLSLNTATVRKQGDLVEIIEACARHGIRAIDPWRDQVAAVGLERAVRAVRDAGPGSLRLLPRRHVSRRRRAPHGGARRQLAVRSTRPAALGAPCIVLVVGGLPQYSRPGSAPSKDIAAARAQVEDAIAEMLEYAQNGRHAACDRTAASGLCGRPGLRQHHEAGARHLRSARPGAHAACSASRSTSITSGGIRN